MPSTGNPPPTSPRGTSPPAEVEAEEYIPYPTSTYPHYSSVQSFHHTPSPATPSTTKATANDITIAAMAADDSILNPFERWVVSANKPQLNAVSGAIGGFTSGVATCPLDVIKTRLQAGGGYNPVLKGRHVGHDKVYKGLAGTFKTIWRTEGLPGLYRGLGPIVMGYLPTWGVWFTVYDLCKDHFREHYSNEFVVSLGSSLIAGGTSTIATNPIWVIKTRLMSQTVAHQPGQHYSQFPKSANTPTSRPMLHGSWHYHSTLDAARKMYTTEGITSFYSGLTPALLGLTHVAVQFPAYEYLKKKFTGQGMGGMDDQHSTWSNWLGVLSASIMSKILASSATYPHEVIRTRLQTQRRPVAGAEYLQGLGIKPPENGADAGGSEQQKPKASAPKYRGVIRTFRTILAEEGWRAFYAGMGTNMMRAVPSATVTMLTYELVMGQLKRAKRTALKKLEDGGVSDADL